MIKKLLLFLLFVAAFGWQGCDAFSQSVGCLSGIIPGTNNRVVINCLTQLEYANGDDLFYSQNYDNIIFTPVDDCDDCLTIDLDDL